MSSFSASASLARVANPVTPAATIPTLSETTQQYITLLQAVLDAAAEESTAPGATHTQVVAAQRLMTQLSSLIGQLTGTQSAPAPYIVTAQDIVAGGLYGIAWRIFGDPLRFADIMRLNTMTGLFLTPGQSIALPVS
jgi:hypothetical protein